MFFLEVLDFELLHLFCESITQHPFGVQYLLEQ